MATLIQSLAIAGCRRPDGTPAASGLVFLYEPGTTSPVLGYRDAGLSQTWTTVAGGIPLDAAGRANIWVNQQVDVVVSDSSGAQVASLLGFNAVDADTVEVQNDGYTGAITDPASGAVTQGPGGVTDLDTVLSSIAESLGGVDGGYRESAGATSRNLHDVIQGIQITPYDFGAIGNGEVDDTVAVQKALNELTRLGGGVLFLRGTFLVSSGLALTGTNGIKIVGVGALASAIVVSVDGVTGLAISNCSNVYLDSFSIVRAGSSTAGTVGVSLANGSGAPSRVTCNNVTVTGFDIAVQDAVNQTSHRDPQYNGLTGSSTSRGLFFSGGAPHLVEGGLVGNAGSTGACIEFKGTAGKGTIVGVNFPAPAAGGTGVLWNASLTGRQFAVVGCSGLSAFAAASGTAFLNNNSADVQLYQAGNGCDVSVYSNAVGNTLQILLANGQSPVLQAVAGGAGIMTVPNPTPQPAGNFTADPYLRIQFINASGGAVTWALGTQFALVGGVAVPSTDGHTINVIFRWDFLAAKWRELSRADMAT